MTKETLEDVWEMVSVVCVIALLVFLSACTIAFWVQKIEPQNGMTQLDKLLIDKDVVLVAEYNSDGSLVYKEDDIQWRIVVRERKK